MTPSAPKTKKAYEPPRLKEHGDLKQLTKSEYGGLDKMLYGSIFAMSSPMFPAPPSR